MVALAGSGVAAAHGIDALGLNPALIGAGTKTFELSFYPIGGYVLGLIGTGNISNPVIASNGLDGILSSLNTNLSSQDKSYIIDALNLNSLTYHIEGTLLAGAWQINPNNALAFDVKQRAMASYHIGAGVDTIVRNVDQSLNFSDIALSNPLSAEGMWFNEYSISYAYTNADANSVADFSIGASVKYIEGLGYAGLAGGTNFSTLTVNDGSLLNPNGRGLQVTTQYDLMTSTAANFNANSLPLLPLYTLFPPSAGTGFGLDIGAVKNMSIGVDKLLTLAFSATDIGSISWNVSPAERNVNRIDTFNLQSVPVDTLKRYAGAAVPTQSFSTQLPTQLHVGASLVNFSANGIIPRMVTFEFTQGLNSVAGNSLSPRVAAGAEWDFGGEYVATGLAYNADENFSWSFGGGVHISRYVLFEIAIGRLNGFWEAPELVNVTGGVKLQF